jgi:negative regulator of flagellin synthesis FlgM
MRRKAEVKGGFTVRIHGVHQTLEVYKKQNSTKAQTKKVEKAKDAVEVSSLAKEYQVAYKALKEVPDVRQEKIDAIKAKIKSGTYSIDAKEVSEKMMSQFDLRG